MKKFFIIYLILVILALAEGTTVVSASKDDVVYRFVFLC